LDDELRAVNLYPSLGISSPMQEGIEARSVLNYGGGEMAWSAGAIFEALQEIGHKLLG
jgi:hypothetical protein